MKKLMYIALLGFTVTVVSSCLKDLDTTPQTEEMLLVDEAWGIEASYEEFLSKIYAGMALSGNSGTFGVPDLSASDQGEATFLRSWWNLQEICTDETLPTEDNESMRGLAFMQWNSNNLFISLNYTRIYLNIAYANEYLRETTPEKVSVRGFDDAFVAKVNGFRAEARALRALHYYFLLDLYGNVPFIDENFPIGSADFEQKGRDFLFPWIVEEINACLPELPEMDMAHYGMFNKTAAKMLLAKLYLNAKVYIGQPMWTECVSALEDVLESSATLDHVYRNVFCADNHLSPEIIFPIIYDGRHAATFGGTTFLIAAASKSDMNPISTLGLTQAWSNNHATETLEDIFSSADNRAVFWKEGRSHDNTVWYDFTNGWSVMKYSNLNSDGTPGSNVSFADTDFPMFRLADAYLMYAEAYLRGAEGIEPATALDYVNQLRRRAGVDEVAISDMSLDFILEERMRELYWEGHRRQDLIRFDKLVAGYKWPWKNGVYIGVSSVSDKYKLYPLPATEVSINPRLTQNEGY